jgi:hypothetical protein
MLFCVQLMVAPMQTEQRLVCSTLKDSAGLDDQYLVRTPDC